MKRERKPHADGERESFPSRGHSRCKGPEAGKRWECVKNGKEAGGKRTGSRVAGGDV